MTTESIDPAAASPRFLIIGAGMAGVLAAIQLQEAGYDFAIYEKADRLGGTWRENIYPGIACDVPSHFYSYSFALNPEWSHVFPPGDEILAYFESVAERYGITPQIQFGEEITRCAFEAGRWQVTTAAGTTDTADYVIAATGVLHHPSIPQFEGQERFEGKVFHSARWDPDLDLAGKRVGVVGTGSSAIQIVGALVDEVEALTLFQRTAQWITPMENAAYTAEQRAEFRKNPEAIQAVRDEASRAFTDGFANVLIDATSPVLEAIQAACLANLENNVVDPVLREKLRPDYRATCKRLVLSSNFYDAIQRPNATVVTEEIERFESNGVRTHDGAFHELDALVLATGFQVQNFVRPMEVRGREGRALDEAWEKGPTAHLAITVPGFPNFFMLNGPNSPVGNFSLIEVAELQFAYVMNLIERVRAEGKREVCATPEALSRFDTERREAAKNTIWASGCKSWYLDENGLPTAWPFTFDRFREEMASPRLSDYERA